MRKFDVLSFYGHENEELQKEYERMFCKMTQEEKQLLIKDLCARLPYGVKVNHFGIIKELLGGVPSSENVMVGYDINNYEDSVIEDIKPYLRPMSSMTLEEHGRYMDFIFWSYNDYDAKSTTCVDKERVNEYKEFIYSHHLDDGDLIGKGLALEAPEDMYKID